VTTSGTAAFRTRAFAKRLGVSDRWLHHLEATGQIPRAERTAAGARWWPADVVEGAVTRYRARVRRQPPRVLHLAQQRRADLGEVGRAFAACWSRSPALASQYATAAAAMQEPEASRWLAHHLRLAARG
jgi:hypothetical protein